VIFPTITPGDAKVDRAMRQVSGNLTIIVEESARLTALINDTLDLAKIEAGRMDWRDEPVEVGLVIERAVAATDALLTREDSPTLSVDVGPDLPVIRGDQDRLIQVVINLLSNAIKFTPAGTITVTGRSTPGGLEVAVADTGRGIAPEDHDKVFEQFGQAGDTLTDRRLGTGLGLSICREIVEHHGGQLMLESAVGVGSTFTFSLPAEHSPHG
jgi:signal transduction histidine kinase